MLSEQKHQDEANTGTAAGESRYSCYLSLFQGQWEVKIQTIGIQGKDLDEGQRHYHSFCLLQKN